MPEHEEQRTIIGHVVGDVVSGNKVTHHHHGDARYDVRGLANPFIGLSSFTYSERAIFAGRERAVAEAVGRLTAPESPATIMFITGASGAGKSSFVQAGLLPAIEQHYAKRGLTVRHAIFRPRATRSWACTMRWPSSACPSWALPHRRPPSTPRCSAPRRRRIRSVC